jgi:hypothetical protein
VKRAAELSSVPSLRSKFQAFCLELTKCVLFVLISFFVVCSGLPINSDIIVIENDFFLWKAEILGLDPVSNGSEEIRRHLTRCASS